MIKNLRLKIAPWQESHAEDFLKLTQDQGFNLFPKTIYRQESLESARYWILNAKTKWGVWEHSSGELIGMELAEALVKYGQDKLALSRISATITPDNTASIKIAEKLGMKFSEEIILLAVETYLYRLEN
jgi:bisphosphoglycerate-dependent phosphoglycerate mutase